MVEFSWLVLFAIVLDLAVAPRLAAPSIVGECSWNPTESKEDRGLTVPPCSIGWETERSREEVFVRERDSAYFSTVGVQLTVSTSPSYKRLRQSPYAVVWMPPTGVGRKSSLQLYNWISDTDPDILWLFLRVLSFTSCHKSQKVHKKEHG